MTGGVYICLKFRPRCFYGARMDLDTRIDGSDALVEEIAGLFGLPFPVTWRDLGGSWTTNLLLEYPGRPLVTRIYQGYTSPDRLAAVQAARQAVGAAGIPTVVPAFADRPFVTLSGGRLAEVEPYVHWNARMSTVPLLEAGFGVLARLHDVLRTAVIPAAARTVRYANHIYSEDALSATFSGADLIRGWGDAALSAFADEVTAHVSTVDSAERPLRAGQLRQVVHGDFWDNNVLFLDDVLVALLDFDFMAERPRVDDLALTAYFYLLEPGKGLPGPADRLQLRRFVDCYDVSARVPLSDSERAALPLAIARQPAWSVGRWVLELDEPEAKKHAAAAATELPVAQAILADLPAWQDALLRK
jgi:homoserine kinase type II